MTAPLAPTNSRRRTAIWNVVFLFVGITIPIISGVILVPIYLEYIDPLLFSLWLASGNILSWISVVDPGLAIVVQQKVAAAFGARKIEDLNRVTGSGLIINVAISVLFAVAVLLFASLLPSVLKITNLEHARELSVAFIWAGLGTALALFSFAVAAINQGLQNSLATGLISVVFQAIRIPFIYILLILGCGVSSLGVGLFISGAFMAAGQLVLMFVLFRQEGIRVEFSRRGLTSLTGDLSFSALLRVGTIGVYYMDLVVVNWMLGPASVAVLKFTRTACDVARPLVQRPAVALQAPLTHLLADQRNGEKGRRIVARFLAIETWAIGLLVGLLVGLNGEFVEVWVGRGYFGGIALNTALALAFSVEILGQILFNIAIAADELKRASIVSFVQAGIFLVVLATLLPSLGLIAVPLSMGVSVVLAQGCYYPWMLVHRYGFSRAELRQLISVFIPALVSTALVIVVLIWLRLPYHGYAGLVAKALMGVSCFVVSEFALCAQFRVEVRAAVLSLRALLMRVRGMGH